MTQDTRRVLSAGQCTPDHAAITRMLQSVADVQVDAVDSADAAFEAAAGGVYDLVLINRVFDATGERGLDLITRLREDGATKGTGVMLVSNLEDAQADAERRGALPGFGKASLHAPDTLERVRAALSVAST